MAGTRNMVAIAAMFLLITQSYAAFHCHSITNRPVPQTLCLRGGSGLAKWFMGQVSQDVGSMVVKEEPEPEEEAEEEEEVEEVAQPKKAGGITGWFLNQVSDDVASMTADGRKAVKGAQLFNEMKDVLLQFHKASPADNMEACRQLFSDFAGSEIARENFAELLTHSDPEHGKDDGHAVSFAVLTNIFRASCTDADTASKLRPIVERHIERMTPLTPAERESMVLPDRIEEEQEEEEQEEEEAPKKKPGGITGWFMGQLDDNIATMTKEGRKPAKPADVTPTEDKVTTTDPAAALHSLTPQPAPEAANVAAKIQFFEDEAAKNKAKNKAGARKPPPPPRAPPAKRVTAATLPAVRFTDAREFVYQSDFDCNGLLYFIGTNFGTLDTWHNPASLQLVTVRMESVAYSGSVTAAVSRTRARLRSKLRKEPWMSVDLGAGRQFVPNRYTLRHGGHANEAPLRDWVLEGSNDEGEWRVLREHADDHALKGEYATASWDVTASNAYRFFRVKATNPRPVQLSIGGFELYGKLLAME